MLSKLSALGPRFWLFAAGLALIALGAYQVHPAAAPFLVGLLLVWDCTRTPPAPRR